METPLTPLEFARRARSLYPDRLAVVDSDLRLTYEQFFDRCDRWSSVLASWNVVEHDRVAYIAPNTHAQLESFYAVPQLGATLVPLNYRLTADDFEYMINHCGAKVVCVHGDYLETVNKIRGRCTAVEHWVALEGEFPDFADYETLLAAQSPQFSRPAINERDIITINYTSGTTSRPKGVMITHRNAWTNSVGTLLHHPMTPSERYLWTLPMFHANGWTFTWTITAIGGVHVCLRKVAPPEIFERIKTEAITALCCAPTVLISIANASEELRAGVPRGVRVLTAGAAPAASTIERIEDELGWTVTQVYGLTETAPFITICEPREEHASLSPGERATIKARQGVELVTSGELRVVDEAMHDVPRDGATIGEIVVRGNVVMAGYYQDPAASELAFAGGFFHTGDSAVMHPDGYVEIRDRLKDVIISGGENISSIEVEAALLRHPAIQEIAIVGLPHEKWGEAPYAFVVLKPGASATEAELRQFARDHLAHFKAPAGVTFVTELPKTATGKIQKFVLRGNKSAVTRQ
ncbi:MAG TPA: long-chain-fatty-acid--CoA ligase [Kofleriaceae bacterium]